MSHCRRRLVEKDDLGSVASTIAISELALLAMAHEARDRLAAMESPTSAEWPPRACVDVVITGCGAEEAQRPARHAPGGPPAGHFSKTVAPAKIVVFWYERPTPAMARLSA